MTNQEIFDKVVRHLVKQGARAINEVTKNCLYRTRNGKKCAIGCLIDDAVYTPDLENHGVDEPKIRTALRKSGIRVYLGSKRQELLVDLQFLHDTMTPKTFKTELNILADKYNLQLPKLSGNPASALRFY